MSPSEPLRVIAVVVPAHDEELLIGASLDAIELAAGHADLVGLDVRVLVVLDQCTDGTAAVCAGRGVRTTEVDVHSVGRARALGFSQIIGELLCTGDEPVLSGQTVWLATTDADTRVAPDWLSVQLAVANGGADAVFGVIDVDDWTEHPPGVMREFARHYPGTGRERTGLHAHVHGANMGLRLSAFLRVGGIPELSVGEDQALSDRLDETPEVTVLRTTALRATTSARPTSRVRGGFADFLRGLATARAAGIHSDVVAPA